MSVEEGLNDTLDGVEAIRSDTALLQGSEVGKVTDGADLGQYLWCVRRQIGQAQAGEKVRKVLRGVDHELLVTRAEPVTLSPDHPGELGVPPQVQRMQWREHGERC